MATIMDCLNNEDTIRRVVGSLVFKQDEAVPLTIEAWGHVREYLQELLAMGFTQQQILNIFILASFRFYPAHNPEDIIKAAQAARKPQE